MSGPDSPVMSHMLKSDKGLRVRPLGPAPRSVSDLYHVVLRASWPQLIGLFMASFLAFNLLFAFLYWLDPGGIQVAPGHQPAPFWDDFFFSVHTVATVGYGNNYPVSSYANVLVVIEVTLGILFFALTTGIAFARFSRPTARMLFSPVAVITPVERVPTLRFRAANQRHNLIFEASANVTLLANERVQDRILQRFRDLSLERELN